MAKRRHAKLKKQKRRRKARFLFHLTMLCISWMLLPFSAQAQTAEYIKSRYTKSEHMVPMRDGVKLSTAVYTPKDTSMEYPILLKRTPYGIGAYGEDEYRSLLGPSPLFAREGYIFVYQDIRGKYPSEGDFVHHRPYDPQKESLLDTDESTDAYDTIQWVLENIPGHNGRVGVWGISYDGWLACMAMIDPHPAIKAVSPQGAPADQYVGDDYYHNGAFRLMYAFDWTWRYARDADENRYTAGQSFEYGTNDGYRFFLELGSISNVNAQCFHHRIPTWNDFVKHWTYDGYWQSKNLLKDLVNVTVPVLNVVGWFDAEDFYGPLGIYQTIERTPGNESILVVGPWKHGGWSSMNGSKLGDIAFDSRTSYYFRQYIELPFFNYHLKDNGRFELPEATVFETGANRWRDHEQWPPEDTESTALFFHPGGGLFAAKPEETSDGAWDSFVSDPAQPVPYTAELRTTQGHLWMVEDQRFAAQRPDVLVYQTEPLAADVTIAGPITACLYASTTGTDADWIVKLIDVFPSGAPPGGTPPSGTPPAGEEGHQSTGGNQTKGGYQMLLAGDVIRGKFRNSLSEPEPMVPGQVAEIRFSLLDKYHTFLKGHRIMVQVQSSWFPLIDRNPQTFAAIPEAVDSDFQKATHKVYRSVGYPSHVTVRIMKESDIKR